MAAVAGSLLAAMVMVSATLVLAAPGWSTATSMPTSRQAPGAATGIDGRIYAFGGSNQIGSPLAAAEAYTPGTNSWVGVAAMPTARFGPAAATGRDGRIFVIGGGNGGPGGLVTVEAYTPGTNTWATVAPMPTGRRHLTATTGLDGRIYAIGGYDGSYLTTVEVYTPTTNTWATASSMATARYALAAVTGSDGRIYAIGGDIGTSLGFTTVEAYTPTTNTWTTVAPMHIARSSLGAATGPDGHIYAFGGFNGAVLSSVEAYTPVTDTWAAAPSMPTALYSLNAATGPDGRLYTIGGNNGGLVTGTLQVFDTGFGSSFSTRNTTGLPGTEFLFGESCPSNAAGAVTACFLGAGDSVDGSTLSSGRIYASNGVASLGNPGDWTSSQSAPGVITSISCVDPGTTANPDIHCYGVSSAGNLVECRGMDRQTVSGSGSGSCNNPAGGIGDWDQRTLVNRAGMGKTLFGIHCPTKDVCLAAGEDGTILYTQNASANLASGNSAAIWTDLGTDLVGTFLFAAVCPSTTSCYVGGADLVGGLYVPVLYRVTLLSATTGTVSPAAIPASVGAVNALACANFNTDGSACFAAADNKVLSGTGTSWTVTTATGGGLGIGCSDASAGKDCSVGGYAGNILSTADGVTWGAQASPSGAPEYDGATCFRHGTVSFCQLVGRSGSGNTGIPVLDGRAANTSGVLSSAASTRRPPGSPSATPVKLKLIDAAAAPAAPGLPPGGPLPRLPRAGYPPVAATASRLPHDIVPAVIVAGIAGPVVCRRRGRRRVGRRS